MQRKTNHRKQLSSPSIVRVNLTGFPFVPGIGLILLGAIIFLAPKFFLAAIGTFFVLLGIGACYIAWKFMAFKRQVSKLAEDFHNSVDVGSFRVQNSDDIDITETDSKKIYYH
jgi:hypothetical protein